MKQEDWTKRLRDRLADHEEAVPEDLWAGIEAKLAQQAAPKQRSRIVPLWGRWAAAAAVLAGVLLGADYLMQETETDMITAGNGSGHIAEVKVKDVEDSQNASDSQATDNVIPMKSQGFVAQLKQVASSVEELFVPESVQEEPLVAQVEEQPVEEQSSEQEPTESKPAEKQVTPKKSLPKEEDVLRELDRKIEMASKQRRPHAGFGLYASNSFGNQVNSNGVVLNPAVASNYNLDNYRSAGTRSDDEKVYAAGYGEEQKHYQPISFGLTTSIPISPRFAIATGLVYTRLSSDIKKEMPGKTIESEQSLHYLGIPVDLQYQIWNSKGFRFYASAGGQVDFNVKAKLTTDGVNSSISRDDLQFSVQGALGLQYDIIPVVGIYVEPGIKYYFKNGSDVRNFFKDKPTNFNLQIGVRLNLGNQ